MARKILAPALALQKGLRLVCHEGADTDVGPAVVAVRNAARGFREQWNVTPS
jgi:nanoRNase/pAp phosphatase (c-di-AMP/oligoRNAs hydrolase)